MNMKRVLFVLLTAALFLISARVPSYGQELKKGTVIEVKHKNKRIILYEGSYALLIGNSEYEYWSDLKSIPQEMKSLNAALEYQGFVVENHKDLTCEELRKTINHFINQYGFEKNNRLLICFSGHGYTRERRNKQIGYILPVDATTDKSSFF